MSVSCNELVRKWVGARVQPAIATELGRHRRLSRQQPNPGAVELAALFTVALLGDVRHLSSEGVWKLILQQRQIDPSDLSPPAELAWNELVRVWNSGHPYWRNEAQSARDQRHVFLTARPPVSVWSKHQVFTPLVRAGLVAENFLPAQFATTMVPVLLADPRDELAEEVVRCIADRRDASATLHQEALAAVPPAPTPEEDLSAVPTPADYVQAELEGTAVQDALNELLAAEEVTA